MPLKVHGGVYPRSGFRFCNNDTKKITIINEEDFPIDDITKWLGIQGCEKRMSFGNCDGDEARERLSILKFIHENPKFISLVALLRANSGVPITEERFRFFYDPAKKRNPFWEEFYNLVSFLEAKGIENLPARIKVFYDSLISFKGLEVDEKEMARICGEMLEANVVMEGAITIQFSVLGQGVECYIGRSKTNLFYGHKTFSYGLSEARQKSAPDWSKNKEKWQYWFLAWNLGLILRTVFFFYNKTMKKRAFQSMVLTDCPREIKEDIARALEDIFTRKAAEGTVNTGENVNFISAFPRDIMLEAVVHFAYGKGKGEHDGLDLKILDIRPREDETIDEKKIISFFSRFEGYSSERSKIILKGQKKLMNVFGKTFESLRRAEIRHEILVASQELALFFEKDRWTSCYRNIFEATHCVPSPNTDNAHKWKTLETIYNLPEIRPVYDAVLNFHGFVSMVGELISMNDVLSLFVAKAKEIKTTLCFPEILPDDKNVVEFSELYPLHLLLGEGEKVIRPVPINNLPSLNGKMIGLTGRNGGGKTVTEHTIAGNIYLALSGFPVFGKNFRLNPKTHIGLVFVEGVKGRSVAQTLLDKTEKLFVGIRNIPQSRVVVIVDELGSNTQATAGNAFGQRVLKTLAQMKDTSVIFSTQILELAEFAEKDLGAKCFFVNKKHQLQPGIKGGEFLDLVEQTELRGILVD